MMILVASLLAVSLDSYARPFPGPGLVSKSTYASWTSSKKIAYVREAKRAFARLEKPRPMVMEGDGSCLVGGVVRDVIPGTNLCPTTGNACEGSDDEGFTCGLIYNAVCVSRQPVASLTARCEAGDAEYLLSAVEFEDLREHFADIEGRCANDTFGRRNAVNCELFNARLAYLNARYTGADERTAGQAVGAVMTPVPRPAAAPVCRGEPYRITRDKGGIVGQYLTAANELRDSGRKLEIRGSCASACLMYLAQVPKVRICVAPGAQLGFHQARDLYTGQVDQAFTAALVAQYYSPELKSMWNDHYSATTALNTVNYPELTRYYATCDTPADVCSPAGLASAAANDRTTGDSAASY